MCAKKRRGIFDIFREKAEEVGKEIVDQLEEQNKKKKAGTSKPNATINGPSRKENPNESYEAEEHCEDEEVKSSKSSSKPKRKSIKDIFIGDEFEDSIDEELNSEYEKVVEKDDDIFDDDYDEIVERSWKKENPDKDKEYQKRYKEEKKKRIESLKTKFRSIEKRTHERQKLHLEEVKKRQANVRERLKERHSRIIERFKHGGGDGDENIAAFKGKEWRKREKLHREFKKGKGKGKGNERWGK